MPRALSMGWFYVPYQAIGDADRIRQEKQSLTYVPRFAEDDDDPVRLFRDLPARELLGMPRAYAMERFSWLKVDDQRTLGEEAQRCLKLPSPDHPAVLNPVEQQQFMIAMRDATHVQKHFIAYAPTGSGKTVVALWNAAQFRRKTLIMVHLERLMDQWIEEIQDKLGVPRSRIGIAQGPKCEFEGKDFVVGMMKSLSMAGRRYPAEFYRSFGMVITDEVHRVGAPLLSHCAPLFPAMYRIGLSATPKRKDGGDRVFLWNIGPVVVHSEATALPCTVFAKTYHAQVPLWGSTMEARIKCLSLDPVRNQMIAQIIFRMHRAGRQVLIIGANIAQLQKLQDICAGQFRVPREAMGQYTGERHLMRPVRLQNGTISERVYKKVKVTRAEYARIKKDCPLIFATYGVFSEGIDVPRLDAGIDVTPRADAEQVVGRIRRPVPGKPTPVWVTIYDSRCKISKNLYTSRTRDYLATGCQMKPME